MPEQESMKVYELAKELGLDSFALLDKLKQINIEVKSHMSSLEAAQADAVRAALKPQKKDTATVKNRSAASSTATRTAAPKKLAKKTTEEKTESEAAPAPKAKAAEAAAAGGAKRKNIKRRRSEKHT